MSTLTAGWSLTRAVGTIRSRPRIPKGAPMNVSSAAAGQPDLPPMLITCNDTGHLPRV
jgi:hypothetical protein